MNEMTAQAEYFVEMVETSNDPIYLQLCILALLHDAFETGRLKRSRRRYHMG